MGEIKVKDSFRTNDLSLKPGGSIVEVHHTGGLILTYDKIKNYERYVASIIKDGSIERIYVDGEIYYVRE